MYSFTNKQYNMIQFKRVKIEIINIVTNEKNYETRHET